MASGFFVFPVIAVFFRFATCRVAAGRQGTVLQVLKGRSRLFPDISGFFRFENALFKSFRKNVKNRQTRS
jgi:hypothetical protein